VRWLLERFAAVMMAAALLGITIVAVHP